MKIVRIKILLSATSILCVCGAKAQTTNSGDLFISSGTIVSTVSDLDNTAFGELTNNGELYVYSHYNNDGLVNFTKDSKTGTTFMKGSGGHQEISGSVPMDWNHAEFDNAHVQPAFHLSDEIRISGTANFKNGIVDDDTYKGLMIFESDANHTNVRNESHVDGEVRKNGNKAFTFPIGDGGYYRYARISSPQSNGDAFTGKYFLEDSDFSFSHTSKEAEISLIDNAEYWTIDKSDGNGNVFLTLSWNENTTPHDIYTFPHDEIHIVHWDDMQKKWVDIGGAANQENKEVSMVINPLQTYGVFTLARVKAESDLIVYNAVSADDNGSNDYFKIKGIENYKKNTVEIYNRWGVKVYEHSGYDNGSQAFRGFSEGRATVNKGEKLPVGTYFYIINAEHDSSGKKFKKSGYLYLNYL